MSARQCWTCNTVHDLDEACPASQAVRTYRAAGPLDDFTSSDALFGDAPEKLSGRRVAAWPGTCPAGDEIKPGDMIVGTDDGWMHEECARD